MSDGEIAAGRTIAEIIYRFFFEVVKEIVEEPKAIRYLEYHLRGCIVLQPFREGYPSKARMRTQDSRKILSGDGFALLPQSLRCHRTIDEDSTRTCIHAWNTATDFDQTTVNYQH